jgi:hypothetical protein
VGVDVASLVAAALLLGLLVPEVLATHRAQHLLCLEAPAAARIVGDWKACTEGFRVSEQKYNEKDDRSVKVRADDAEQPGCSEHSQADEVT